MSLWLPQSRREFIQTSAFATALFTTPGAFADRILTPTQTEGPFYPDKLPLDTDNDLLVLNDSITPAVGTIAHLTGKIMSPSGEPVRNAVVEIWQCDNNGVYIHSKGGDRKKIDGNFQGFGRFMTNMKGEYYFRTIKPVEYVGRTPHIHMAVFLKSKRVLTTQVYIKGHKMNAADRVMQHTNDRKNLNLLMAEFKPLKGSKIGEVTANFDVVIGHTPADPEKNA